jgi:hypothetical protein
MATQVWPPSLPETPLLRGFSQKESDNDILRSEMGVGPAKVRLRSTANVSNNQSSILITDAQKTTLQTFYGTTLLKVKRFDWTDQLTGVTEEFRFVSAPIYVPVGIKWSVALNLEILP